MVLNRPVAGKSPWGGPSPPNFPKSPLFVRVPPYLHTKIFPMGGAMAPLAPPSATGLVLNSYDVVYLAVQKERFDGGTADGTNVQLKVRILRMHTT